jgi:hypothetical protein
MVACAIKASLQIAIKASLQMLKVASAALNPAAQDRARLSAADANFDDAGAKGTDLWQLLLGRRDHGQLDQRSLRKRILYPQIATTVGAEMMQSQSPLATERPDRSLIWLHANSMPTPQKSHGNMPMGVGAMLRRGQPFFGWILPVRRSRHKLIGKPGRLHRRFQIH